MLFGTGASILRRSHNICLHGVQMLHSNSAIGSATLGFSIMGVARSGTSALVQAANLAPHVFCSHEWKIGTRREHFCLEFPKAFFNQDDYCLNGSRREFDRSILIKKQKECKNVTHGNKIPEYFWIFDLLNYCFPAAKHTAIYRSPLTFTQSWDRRASNPADAGWHRGRRGFFAIFEWLIFLDCLARFPYNINIVSYDAFFFRSTETYIRWIECITGVPPNEFSIKEFKKFLFKRDFDEEERARHCPYAGLLHEIDVMSVDKAIVDFGFGGAENFTSKFDRIVTNNADAVAVFVADHVRKANSGEVREYGQNWAARLKNTFSDQYWRNDALARNALWLAAALQGDLAGYPVRPETRPASLEQTSVAPKRRWKLPPPIRGF